jgi:hypothetical protein
MGAKGLSDPFPDFQRPNEGSLTNQISIIPRFSDISVL